MKLHVGCAMWNHAPWQGRYLPGSLAPRDRLRAYATWCNAVEGNTTFYATPALPTVRSWAGQTGPDFRARPVDSAAAVLQPGRPGRSHRSRALTPYPVVRYIGRDDAARTVAGWQPWLETVAGWLREGRSPTVFIHTPDNVDALELARRFHDEVRVRVPEVEPLPEPVPAGPPTLF
jgi:uncharacterized protein YecE (DUF72 family)